MAYKFSTASRKELESCHLKLQVLFNEVIQHWNCTIIEGHRPKELQQELLRKGKTQLEFPNSKHNENPSTAVDVAPYHADEPHIRWDNPQEFAHFAGFVKGIAVNRGLDIRWGGDWDMDGVPVPEDPHEDFDDLVHFELHGEPGT